MGSRITHGSLSMLPDSANESDDESGQGSTLSDLESQDILQEGYLIGRRSTLIHAQSHKFFRESNTNSMSKLNDSI